MNKFLIPAALIATVVIAGIFAFMPVEKASTVHGTLATSAAQTTTDTNVDNELDQLDRAMHFSLNMSRDGTKGIFTLIPAKSGKTLSGNYLLSAQPNNHTTNGNGGSSWGAATTFSCGLVDGQGTVLSGTNASKNVPANGTLSPTAGRAVAVQYDRTNSNVGGVCTGTIFLDKNSGETVP